MFGRHASHVRDGRGWRGEREDVQSEIVAVQLAFGHDGRGRDVSHVGDAESRTRDEDCHRERERERCARKKGA